jgi:probable F420-dependent oxidoreductase
MRVDLSLPEAELADVRAVAEAADRIGAAGLFVPEARHDPFLVTTVAAEHSRDIEIGTSVAIAFARNPMNTAQLADDLQRFSHGRFVLGLGTQIRPHITRRFSMPWERPVGRLREYVLALRAIWASWHTDAPLDFTGEHYTHTLMPPVFNPGPTPYGPPRVWVAAVGAQLGAVAGEVGDGLITHPLTTPRYLEEVLRPAIERGRAAAGEPATSFEIAGMAMVATGADDATLAAAIERVRLQVAFYGSTPAYAPILELHGWSDLQPELRKLTRENRWAEMAALVTDDLLELLAVVGPPNRVGEQLRARYARGWDRVSIDVHRPLDPDLLADIVRDAQEENPDG